MATATNHWLCKTWRVPPRIGSLEHKSVFIQIITSKHRRVSATASAEDFGGLDSYLFAKVAESVHSAGIRLNVVFVKEPNLLPDFGIQIIKLALPIWIIIIHRHGVEAYIWANQTSEQFQTAIVFL